MIDVNKKIREMLAEDIGAGDITSQALIEPTMEVRAEILANQAGILAGTEEAAVVFDELGVKAKILRLDGSGIKAKTVIMKLDGPAMSVLAGERVALNLLMRMSGIATVTREFLRTARKKNPKVLIAATRKTAPLLSYFDKRAVVAAGGLPHRYNLGDQVLIKDNHWKLVGSIGEAVHLAKIAKKGKIEIEACNVNDVLIAARARADIIMLDNMTPAQIKRAITELKKEGLRKKVVLEASGGINLSNVEDFAATGVDMISSSHLTMRAPAIDMSLEIKSKGYKALAKKRS